MLSARYPTKEEKELYNKSPSLEILENDLSSASGSHASTIKIFLLPESHDLIASAEAVVGRSRILFTKASTG